MKNLVYIKNNNNNTEQILSLKSFKKLRHLFSENSTYKYISQEEANRLAINI
jgi:hypothetical protein